MNLKVTETATGCIAHEPAMQTLAERRSQMMDNEKLDSVLLYKTAMAGVKMMLKQGIITPEEYAEIDTMILEDFGLSLSVIFRLKPLI